jgi:hypothetical protein
VDEEGIQTVYGALCSIKVDGFWFALETSG